MGVLLTVLLTLLSSAGCKRTSASASVHGIHDSSPNDGWLVYEDFLFHVRYPPGSEVFGPKDGRQDPLRPTLGIVPPPAAGSTLTGMFGLQLDPATKGMLLRDALDAEIQRHLKGRGVLMSGPKTISVRNGTCLSALVIAPADSCPAGQGTCYQPYCPTRCDGPGERRYDASSMLSQGHDPSALSPEARREFVVYERMLQSLEFKNPPNG